MGLRLYRLLLLIVFATTVGCGSSKSTPDVAPTPAEDVSSEPVDVAPDIVPDVAPSDIASNVNPDIAPSDIAPDVALSDVRPDSAPSDIATDLAPDVVPDIVRDVANPDAASDVANRDVAADVLSDIVPDVGPDIGPDAASDVRADVPGDVPGDTVEGPCRSDADCEDYDLCTIDSCVEGEGCVHTPRREDCRPCGSDGDCDDGDPCTLDGCVADGLGCVHTPVDDCIPCQDVWDCPGDDICTRLNCVSGACRAIEGAWNEPGVPGCINRACSTSEDCDDGDPRTQETCNYGDGACIITPPQSCETVADCHEMIPCREVVGCEAGACVFAQVADCPAPECESAEDCDDGDRCTFEMCPDGRCHWLPDTEDCCEGVDDCGMWIHEPWDGCHTPACDVTRSCHTLAFGSDNVRCGQPCDSDEDCAPTSVTLPCPPDEPDCVPPRISTTFCLGTGECYDWPCVRGACTQGGNCVWFEGDCRECRRDLDCADPDPCTLDTCVDGACVHAPDPQCSPTACGPRGFCDSGDRCVLGLCLTGGCVWVPNPQCE